MPRSAQPRGYFGRRIFLLASQSSSTGSTKHIPCRQQGEGGDRSVSGESISSTSCNHSRLMMMKKPTCSFLAPPTERLHLGFLPRSTRKKHVHKHETPNIPADR